MSHLEVLLSQLKSKSLNGGAKHCRFTISVPEHVQKDLDTLADGAGLTRAGLVSLILQAAVADMKEDK